MAAQGGTFPLDMKKQVNLFNASGDVGTGGSVGYVSFKFKSRAGDSEANGGTASPNQDGKDAESIANNIVNKEATPEEVKEATGGETGEGAETEQESEEKGFWQTVSEKAKAAKEDIQDFAQAVETIGDAFGDVMREFTGAEGERQAIRKGTPALTFPSDGDVLLYLPPGFQMNEGVGYDGVDLGVVGSAIEAAAGQGMDAVRAGIGKGIQTTFGDITSGTSKLLAGDAKEAKELTELASLQAARFTKMFGNQIGDGLQAAMMKSGSGGITVNPNTRAFFRRVNLREFSFNFTLVPSNAEEAAEIDNIIYYFRENMLPEAFETTGLGYKFPKECQITMGSGNGWNAPKFLPCVLRTCAVTFNPNAMAFHTDGNPVETQLSLNFMETQALDYKKLKELEGR